jgi:hypothetical protein
MNITTELYFNVCESISCTPSSANVSLDQGSPILLSCGFT